MILQGIYRIFVSCLLAFLMTSLVGAIGIGVAICWFGGFGAALKEGHENNEFKYIFMSLTGSSIAAGIATVLCGLSRLTTTKIGFRQAIYRDILPASVIATLFGIAFGIAYLPSPDRKFELFLFLEILAGLLGAIIIVTSHKPPLAPPS